MSSIKSAVLAAILIAIDLITKSIAYQQLLHSSIVIIPNFFSLTYTENTGAAWSMMAGKQQLLTTISLIGAVIFTYMFSQTKKDDWFGRLCLTMMIAGTLGNFYDRFMLGYVRDFLSFIIFNYDFPIFNVADMLLCIGVFGLLIQTMLGEKHGKV